MMNKVRTFNEVYTAYMGLPWWLRGNESACNAGDPGSVPGSGRSPGRGNGNPLQYSCLENRMTEEPGGLVHGVAQSWTRLKQLSSSIQHI